MSHNATGKLAGESKLVERYNPGWLTDSYLAIMSDRERQTNKFANGLQTGGAGPPCWFSCAFDTSAKFGRSGEI